MHPQLGALQRRPGLEGGSNCHDFAIVFCDKRAIFIAGFKFEI
jgi:hypothetical protein